MKQRFEHMQVNWKTFQDDWMHQSDSVNGHAKDGWELVSANVYRVPDRNYSKTVLWFKRPFVEEKPAEQRRGGGGGGVKF